MTYQKCIVPPHTSLHYPSGVVLCVFLSFPVWAIVSTALNKLLSLLGGPLGMSDRFTPSCFFYISLSAVANNIALLRYITIKASCQDAQLQPRVAEQRKRGEVFDRDTLGSPKPSLIWYAVTCLQRWTGSVFGTSYDETPGQLLLLTMEMAKVKDKDQGWQEVGPGVYVVGCEVAGERSKPTLHHCLDSILRVEPVVGLFTWKGSNGLHWLDFPPVM